MALPKDCVYPDGSVAVDGFKGPQMVPCDATASVSSCCASNDTCIANGMCLSNDLFYTVELVPVHFTRPGHVRSSASKLLMPKREYVQRLPAPLNMPRSSPKPHRRPKALHLLHYQRELHQRELLPPPNPVTAANITGFASNTTCAVAVTVIKKTGISTRALVAAVVVPIVILLVLGALLWYWEHRKRVKAEYEAKDWEDTAHRTETQMIAQVENRARNWENHTQTQMNGGSGSLGSGNRKNTGSEPFTATTPLSELSGTGNPLSGKRAPW